MTDETESVRLVAVTACPTGIAHSQMAAESLETTATEMGHEITVEIQGAMGTQNELTPDDIDAADAVVIAADTSVRRDRFDSLPVIKATVREGVSDAERLIEEAIAEATASADDDSSDTAGASGDSTEAVVTDRSERPDESVPDDSNDSSDPPGIIERLKRLFT